MCPVSSATLVGSNTSMSGIKEYLRMHFEQSTAGSRFSSWVSMLNEVGFIFKTHQTNNPE